MLSVDIPCDHIMTCCTPPAPHMVTRACNDSSISAEAGSPRKHGAGGAGGADGACQQDPLTTARTDGGPLARVRGSMDVRSEERRVGNECRDRGVGARDADKG